METQGQIVTQTHEQFMEQQSVKNKAVVLHVQTGKPGTKKKIGTEIVNTDADKGMVHLSKDIFDSEELAAIRAFDAKIGCYFKKRGLPSHYKGGMYLIPISLIMEVDEKLLNWQEHRQSLVDNFCQKYDDIISRAEQKLGDLFDPMDYPSVNEIRKKFMYEWRYVSFDTPTVLKGLKIELFQREAAKAEQVLQSQAEEIQQALRVQFRELVESMRLALTPKEDGKKRRFDKSTMENWKEFCDYFKHRNIADDGELQKLVDLSLTIMSNTDPEYIRQSDEARDHMTSNIAYLHEQIGKLTQGIGRAIGTDEDL